MHPSSSSSSHVVIHYPDPNCLAFSLCNHNNDNDNTAPTPFSLFSSFNPTTEEEPLPPHPSSASAVHLSILSGSSPELSDFLGIVPLAAIPRHPSPSPTEEAPAAEIYDASDLKTITASFLQGFSGGVSRDRECQPQPQRQQELQLQVGKKAVDTFGQRSSIYRGVIR